MRATIHTFVNALTTPERSFATLHEIGVKRNPHDWRPAIHRISCYAEAEIYRNRQESSLLFMPLTEELREAAFLQHELPFVAPMRVLRDELCWQDDMGQPCRCDLLLQELPGRPFEVGIELIDTDTLFEAINRLEEDFRQANFAHNNLTKSQLRIVDDRLMVLRPFHATYTKGLSECDRRFFRELRLEVDRYCEQQQDILSDCEADYYTPALLPGIRWRVGNEFEGFHCVEQEEGFCYMDASNQIVIPGRFIYAGDFHENRAVVETATGVGVIDRTGAYIIPPHFETIDYLTGRSIFRALSNGVWRTFDYRGRPVNDHEEINIDTINETILWKR